jgi:hypothetical protein
MKTRTFPFHVDPGHGWAKVPRKLLAELNIEQTISSYSYQRGDFVYLEEDCDMAKLYDALRAKGIEPEWRHRYADQRSRIRTYASFVASSLNKENNATPKIQMDQP